MVGNSPLDKVGDASRQFWSQLFPLWGRASARISGKDLELDSVKAGELCAKRDYSFVTVIHYF